MDDRSAPVDLNRFGIPGTIVFDGTLATRGFALNDMCMSLNDARNRALFQEDAERYMEPYPMPADQRRAVLERDWRTLVESGGNIFFIFKIAIIDGLTMQHIAAAMCGMDIESYRAMMRAGGRRTYG